MSGIVEKRLYAVFAHVRSYRYGIDVEMFEKTTGIHFRRVAYVAAFGIGDDELVGVVSFDITDGFFKGFPALDTETFVKCQIRFVCHA